MAGCGSDRAAGRFHHSRLCVALLLARCLVVFSFVADADGDLPCRLGMGQKHSVVFRFIAFRVGSDAVDGDDRRMV